MELRYHNKALPTALALLELWEPPVGHLSRPGLLTCRILSCSACLHLPPTPGCPSPPISPTTPQDRRHQSKLYALGLLSYSDASPRTPPSGHFR